MTCQHCKEADTIFKPWMVNPTLKRYRKKGPDKVTQIIIDTLQAKGLSKATLTDVGAGIGVIHHELLGNGVVKVFHIDASENFLKLAKEESKRKNQLSKVTFIKADFVDLDSNLPESNIVAMDKVICCYPDANALLQKAADKATNTIAMSFPKENIFFKTVVFFSNLSRKLRKRAFRNYIHKESIIESILQQEGFHLEFQSETFMWKIRVYEKTI